jgi:hypothetical protein
MKAWFFYFCLLNSVTAYGQDLIKDCRMNDGHTSIICGEKIFSVGIEKQLVAQDNTYVKNPAKEKLYAQYGLMAGCKFQDVEKLIIYCVDLKQSKSLIFTQLSGVTPSAKVVVSPVDKTNNDGRTSKSKKTGRGVAGFIDEPFEKEVPKTIQQ